jgi:tight adherence protein C
LDRNLIAIVVLAFATVAALVFVAAQAIASRAQLRRRLPAGALSHNIASGQAAGGLNALVSEHFTEQRFGVDAKLRSRLRRDLLRAGYFGDNAVNYYIFARICTVVVLPILVFLVTRAFLPAIPRLVELLILSITAMIGILGPDGWLSRRQDRMRREYRLIFPDMLDLLVVCVGAGLSIEAAFERIRGQLEKQSRALGANLLMMGAEMRAGRSTIEGLNSLADRLALDEASSFVAVLRHSVELGGDVADALRVFSDEMRYKRLMRAEEQANKLTVKMVLPLALCIFPVILLIALLPVALKFLFVFSKTG